ncbi:MAG: neutral/alkaline non-lysosomal ceramidase N-terminal domain-containing protein [Chloroflexi bacterium]|nr:neutral/alkaline non-lysosomal ceramidase N-terminal domain-containing protein [Chloroflexota bacterium]
MVEQFQAGAVEVDITPPVGSGFDGYSARKGTSLGVLDPLLAQLLLLKCGDDQAVLISMDLLGVSLDFTQRVREGIEQAIGVPGQCTLVACTHTHSGPGGFRRPHFSATQDSELQSIVERKLVGAAIWARERLQPARLGVGRGKVEGIGRNRNDPEKGLLDSEVVVLRVDDASGQPIAIMMNYGCHPTVLGYQNLFFSADYPGAARAALRCLYPHTVFLYTNGASGDVSTRFTRRSQSYDEVERMGRILAGEVLKEMQTIVTRETVSLGARIAVVEPKFRHFPSADEAQREVERLQAELETLKAVGAAHGEIRRATTRVEGAMGQALMAKELSNLKQRSSQVQVMQIGDLALVGLPGEPFTRTVLEIKQQSKYPYTAVVSYANDYLGYFPDAVSIAEETYEALISPYGADAAEELRDVALRLLQEG